MNSLNLTLLTTLLLVAQVTETYGHDGRRFEVVVVDGQLAVQGHVSTSPTADDQGGNPRHYYNALHDHWENNLIAPAATTDLPGFDVYDAGSSFVGNGAAAELAGADLTLTLQDTFKWTSPATSGPVNLTPLSVDDPVISIQRTIGSNTETIDTSTGGSLKLTEDIPATGAQDLDLVYSIPDRPSGLIYILEWILSADNGLADSESIYTIFSPDPDPTNSGSPNPMLGLHHPSLYLESQLGTAIVPEPTTVALSTFVLLAWIFASTRGRR